MVCVGAKAGGLRSVGGAILVLLDQTEEEEEFPVGLSSSDGGGRSPYNPPSMFHGCFQIEKRDLLLKLGF